MITFNETDFNMTGIKQESKLFNLLSVNKYYVFGLTRENNPHILIEFNRNKISELPDYDKFIKRFTTLVNFFESHGLVIELFDGSDERKIDIGLRRDLREIVDKHGVPLFASAIITTIIYCLENRLDLEQLKNFRIPSIPKKILSK